MPVSRPPAAAIRRGPLAAYRQIARDLRNRIAGGEFVAHERLPTEDELMVRFGVSRHTVRSALQMLVNEGLLERYAGRGTFVVERPSRDHSWRIRSLDDIVNENFPADPKILDAVWISASEDVEAANELEVERDCRVLYVTAVRFGPKGPLACSEIFLPEAVGRPLEPELPGYVTRQSLLHLIETRLGIRASRALQVATMLVPPETVAEALNEPADLMTITLLRTYTAADGQPIAFTRLFGKPGIFSNVIEFSRDGTDAAGGGSSPSTTSSPASSTAP